jgi:hypothetical protein
MNRKGYVLLVAVFLMVDTLAPFVVQAQQNSIPRVGGGEEFIDGCHHIIVLVDRSGSMNDTPDRLDTFRSAVTIWLDDLLTDWNLPDGRELYDAEGGDLLSVLSFGLSRWQPDFGEFIEPIPFIAESTSNTTIQIDSPAVRRVNAPFGARLLDAIVDQSGGNLSRYFNRNYSAITTAIPLAARFTVPAMREVLRDPGASHYPDRTFVLLITDGDYNGGGSPAFEIEEIVVDAGRSDVSVGNVDSTLALLESTLEMYSYRKIEERSDPDNQRGVMIKVFELVPKASSFAIEALIEPVQTPIYLRREYDNTYTGSLEVAFRSTLDSASVGQAELVFRNESSVAVGRTEKASLLSPTGGSVAIPLAIPGQIAQTARSVEAQYWLYWNTRNEDGYVQFVRPHLGRRELNAALVRQYPVELERTARILGIANLPTFLYLERFDSQYHASRWWSFIIIGILFVTLLGFYVKFSLDNRTITNRSNSGSGGAK